MNLSVQPFLSLAVMLAGPLSSANPGWATTYSDRSHPEAVRIFSSFCAYHGELDGLRLLIVASPEVARPGVDGPHTEIILVQVARSLDPPIQAIGRFSGDHLELLWRDRGFLNRLSADVAEDGALHGVTVVYGPPGPGTPQPIVLRQTPTDSPIPNCR